MAVQIKVDQVGKPAGVAGRAREDLVTGTLVTLSAQGGPFLSYAWSIASKPVDIFAAVRSSALLATPLAQTTTLSPIDVPGTYMVEVAVDSGSGLGAKADDVAQITFYAGTAGSKFSGPLASQPDRLPRRVPAFGETTQHNVIDAIDPGGNIEGWAREWQRWYAVLQTMYSGRAWAMGRVTLTAGGASLVRGMNVSNVTRTAQGVVTVTFATAMPDVNYLPRVWPIIAVGGGFATSIGTGGFTANRVDAGGSAVDQNFGFSVELGV